MWLAWLAANVSMWMNDVAAAWLMTSLSADPLMVALVQSAAMLPVFLLSFPSGALADIVDRRRFLLATQLWVSATAASLSILAFLDALSAPLLLALVFANGIGLAMRWPLFAAIIPDVVPRTQIAAAVALNAVSVNISRVAGPIVAGLLLASLGGAFVFVLNTLLSLGAAYLAWRWRSEPRSSALPAEHVLGAMRVGIQHVRQSPRFRVILLRTLAFFLPGAALLALLPLLARAYGGGAAAYTALVSCMGAGAIAAGLGLSRAEGKFSRDRVVGAGTLLFAAAIATLAIAPNVWLAAPAMTAAGAAWMAVANSLTVGAQLSLPNWVRARGMSIFQMALMAGGAFGAALWGQVARHFSVPLSLLCAAGLCVVLALVLRRQRLDACVSEDLTPHPVLSELKPTAAIQADDGPIMVTIQYEVDAADMQSFLEVMKESRRSRLGKGALSWGLFRDAENQRLFIEYFLDQSWVEHLRRFERVTASELQLHHRRLGFHRGTTPPVVSRYVAEPMTPSAF